MPTSPLPDIARRGRRPAPPRHLADLTPEQRRQAVREIVRVTRPGGRSYIQVDSWLNEQQHQDFVNWQLTALTFFAPEGWRRLFAEAGFEGDYYWPLAE